uniref:Uncharacterized protein n=1 Tax=Poecilia mexicana TaxID=48701 RepID=A0A3B3XU46_9TELE
MQGFPRRPAKPGGAEACPAPCSCLGNTVDCHVVTHRHRQARGILQSDGMLLLSLQGKQPVYLVMLLFTPHLSA